MSSSEDDECYVTFLRERIKNMDMEINMYRNLIFELEDEKKEVKKELRKKCKHVWIQREDTAFNDLCSKVCIKCNLFNC